MHAWQKVKENLSMFSFNTSLCEQFSPVNNIKVISLIKHWALKWFPVFGWLIILTIHKRFNLIFLQFPGIDFIDSLVEIEVNQ